MILKQFFGYKMLFSKLSTQELDNFLSSWNQTASNRTEAISLAAQLFEVLSERSDASFTIPVINLWISSNYPNKILVKYSEDDIRSLTEENKQIFADTFGLDITSPDFSDRLVQILNFLGAIRKKPNLKLSDELWRKQVFDGAYDFLENLLQQNFNL